MQNTEEKGLGLEDLTDSNAELISKTVTLFDEASDLDLAGRCTLVIEHVLNVVNGNIGYVQTSSQTDPSRFQSVPADSLSGISTIACVSSNTQSLFEPNVRIAKRVLEEQRTICETLHHHGQQFQAVCTAIPTSEGNFGLLHVYRTGDKDAFCKRAEQACTIVGSVLGTLISGHIKLADTQGRLAAVESQSKRIQYQIIKTLSPFFDRADFPGFAELACAAARSRRPLLIIGEPGTGRFQIAKRIHDAATVATRRLVEFDCAEFHEDELEMQLFGQELGVQFDSDGIRSTLIGILKQSQGGTLVLRNLHKLPMRVQARLESAMTDYFVESTGHARLRARLIAIADESIHSALAEGAIRPTLLQLFSKCQIATKPLRDRLDELPSIIHHLTDEVPFARRRPVSHAAIEACRSHDWPRNVAELAETLLAAETSCKKEIQPKHLSLKSADQAPAKELPSLAEIEAQHIATVLQATNGNKREASQILGINRSTLDRRLATASLNTKAKAK